VYPDRSELLASVTPEPLDVETARRVEPSVTAEAYSCLKLIHLKTRSTPRKARTGKPRGTDRWGVDAGVDLVAEDHHGRLWAIQAKAYDPAYRIHQARRGHLPGRVRGGPQIHRFNLRILRRT
jgi:hypothetical protein